MSDAELRNALATSYGGEQVLALLSNAGLEKLYIGDLTKVLGATRAAKIANLTQQPSHNQPTKRAHRVNVGEGNWSFWKQAILWIGALCIGAGIFVFASLILQLVGGAIALVSLGGLFAKSVRGYAVAGLIAGSIIFGWGEAIAPTEPSLPVESEQSVTETFDSSNTATDYSTNNSSHNTQYQGLENSKMGREIIGGIYGAEPQKKVEDDYYRSRSNGSGLEESEMGRAILDGIYQ